MLQTLASNQRLVYSGSQQSDLPLGAVTLIKPKTLFSQMLFPALYAGAFSHIILLREVGFMEMVSSQLGMQNLGTTMIQMKTVVQILSVPMIHPWTFTPIAGLMNLIDNSTNLMHI